MKSRRTILRIDKMLIADHLKKISLYKPVRWVYNHIGRLRSQTEMSIGRQIFRFWTPTFYMNEYVANCGGERELMEKFISELFPSDVIWDVGANIGIYSIPSGYNITPAGVVYAFEPEQTYQSLLKRNIQLNKINNIVPMSFALGDFNGKSILFPSDTPNIGTHSFVQRTDYQLKSKGKSVVVRKADSLVENDTLLMPNVVKIDVEGAEVLVLKGMKKILENKTLRMVQCEVHTEVLPLFGASQSDIESIMFKAGFSISLKKDRGTQLHFVFKR